MKAMIFNGSSKNDGVLRKINSKIESRLAADNWDVKSFDLSDMVIAPCMGCFGCWVKTPGVCVINDYGREVTKNAMDSDLWIFLTPLSFGGYSPDLKKSIDRLLPIFVPVFSSYMGETHHEWRPKKKPLLIAFGLSADLRADAEEIFRRLVERNSINFHSPMQMSRIIRNEYDERFIDDIINEAISRLAIHHEQ